MRENHRYNQAVRDGIKIPPSGYWGNVSSRICGKYGGASVGRDTAEVTDNYNTEEQNMKP